MAEILLQAVLPFPNPATSPQPGAPVPSEQAQGARPQAAIAEEAIRQSVAEAQRQFAGERIGFGYEKRLGVLYVQVYDQATGKVLREFPPEEWLAHRAALSEWIGLLLDQRA